MKIFRPAALDSLPCGHYFTAVHLLITNDDGVRAPGLASLVKALAPDHRLSVVAPDGELSGVGHGITLAEPISIRDRPNGDIDRGWAVRGTPADCVKLAWWELLVDDRPDLVISGINRGANVGLNVFYSGTVAAAREAAMLGLTGLAVSLDDHRPGADFGPAAALTARLVERLADLPAGSGACRARALNVNIPARGGLSLADCRLARQALAAPDERFISRTDPRGNTYYWQDVEIYAAPPAENTDQAVLNQGLVPITPLCFDNTDQEQMKFLSGKLII